MAPPTQRQWGLPRSCQPGLRPSPRFGITSRGHLQRLGRALCCQRPLVPV